MRLPGPPDRRRERTHRFLFPTLVGLLAAFSIWCLWLLWHAERLHGDIEDHLAWIDRVRASNAALESFRDFDERSTAGDESTTGGGSAAPDGRGADPLIDFRARLEEIGRDTDPALLIAARHLRLALDQLEKARRGETGPASRDEIWRSSVAALDSAAQFEGALREHLAQLHRRLGGLRRSLYFLVLGSLTLAASNLCLLLLAHRRRQELEAAHADAVARASHDPLTGLWNREFIVRRLERELARARRSQSPLGVILADLDRFSEVNSLVGQSEGDNVLRQVGELLGSLVRPYDTLGRFGGDSFLMVLPACDDIATARVAERLRHAVEEHDFALALGRVELHLSLTRTTVREADDTDADTVIREMQQSLDEEKPARQGARKPARQGARKPARQGAR